MTRETGTVRRRLTADDLTVWERFTRNVAPLSGARAEPAPAAPADTDARATAPPQQPGQQQAATRRHAAVPETLDRRTALRLRRGRLPIERCLDLHGHTLASGHATLLAFLSRARAAGCRHVLVVTGRGRDGIGALKRAVPQWLAEARFTRHVAAFAEAGPRHGGGGALYVVLRRRD